MNLKQAQQHFSQDAKYRQQYDKQKDGIQLAMHALAVRRGLGISHSELANELGISKSDISKFENLRGRVEPWVISIIVTRFESELRKRGIQVEKWFVAQPQPEATPPESAQSVGALRRRIPVVQTSRDARGTALPVDRQKVNSEEEKESKV